MSNVNFHDITGQRFGRLVAIERRDKNTGRAWRWLCQCDCGNTTIAVTGSLISGRHQSCGCLRTVALVPQVALIEHKLRHPLMVRFEAKYIPEPNSGCWLWLAALNTQGYGIINRGRQADGLDAAHRVAWRLFRGPIPEGLHVLHRCDVPCCVNPDHLFLGSPKDNADDREAKRRGSAPPIRYGEAHHRAKLTVTDVQEIKRRRANGETIRQLAKAFSVGSSAIYAIIIGKTWES